MTSRFAGLALAPVAIALAMLFAPFAGADGYTDQLVARFDSQTHVVADPGARPPLQNPDGLNRQILAGPWRWSSGPPIWVAAVAPAQSGVTTADSIHEAMLRRDAQFSGVILVIDSRGYHVRAYHVPKVVADNVDEFMNQSAQDHRNDPYGAASEFVGKLSGVSVPTRAPVSTSPLVQHQRDDWAWLKAAFVIAGITLATAGLIWFAVSRNRKHRKDIENREQIKQELITAASNVGDLDNEVLTDGNTDVSAESLKANASLHDARKAYEKGDYGAARAHLRVVESTVAKANRKLHPGQREPEGAAADSSVPAPERKQASVRTTDPETGQTVTISNADYRTTAQPGYPHYFGGGYHNGIFFQPGFYPYPFWGPGWGWALGDVLLMDALLDDHWGGGFERGFEAGRDAAFADAGSHNAAANYEAANYEAANYDGANYDGGYDAGGDIGFDGGWDSGAGWDSGGSDSGGDIGF